MYCFRMGFRRSRVRISPPRPFCCLFSAHSSTDYQILTKIFSIFRKKSASCHYVSKSGFLCQKSETNSETKSETLFIYREPDMPHMPRQKLLLDTVLFYPKIAIRGAISNDGH